MHFNYLTTTYNYGSNRPTYLYKVSLLGRDKPTEQELVEWSANLRHFYGRDENNVDPTANLVITHVVSRADVVFSVCFC